MLKRLILSILLVCSLAACSNLNRLMKMEPRGSAFQQDLANNYKQFARSEANKYDWADSSYFAKKGIWVASAREVMPEDPRKWKIPAQAMPGLLEARETLLALLANPQVTKHYPALAAKAFFSYDCWVEEQEENWQPQDIAACRDGFQQAVHAIHTAIAPKAAAPKPEVFTEADAGVTNVEPASEPDYQVFFAFDSSLLTAAAKETLDTMVDEFKRHEVENITVNGYTDTVGSEEYNLLLSKRRAVAVKNFLVGRGIPADKIDVYAFGKHELLVPTPDNKAEVKNRRAKIYLLDHRPGQTSQAPAPKEGVAEAAAKGVDTVKEKAAAMKEEVVKGAKAVKEGVDKAAKKVVKEVTDKKNATVETLGKVKESVVEKQHKPSSKSPHDAKQMHM